MSERYLVIDFLSLLNVFGLNPNHQNKWSRIRTVVTFTLVFHLVIEFCLQMTFYWKGWRAIDSIMICGAALQGLVKNASTLPYRKELSSLLSKMEEFLPLDGLADNFQKYVISLRTIARKYLRIFVVGALFTLFLLLTRPMVIPERMLPFDYYHPRSRDDNSKYALMYFLQIFEGFAALVNVLALDGLFVSFIIEVIFQLKIIKERFVTIKIKRDVDDENRCLKEISQLIDQHNLVLGCVKDLDKNFSMYLLTQFMCSAGSICTVLLGLVASGFPPKLEDVSQYVSFLTTIVSQLFIYCLAGTYLVAESESVSEAVYDSNWWIKTQPKFRKACAMVIQRANETKAITAGGMFILNLENFTKIVKLGLSVFSLAQAVSSDTQPKKLM